MNNQPPLGLGLAALLVTAAAMAVGGPGVRPSAAHETSPAAVEGTSLPFACALLARQEGGSVVLEGQVTGREAVSGTYEMRVRGPGVSIDQAGGLSVAASETVRLGEAMISGRASDYDTSLTVTIGGQTYACQLQEI
jgi:hypothetical protein